MPTAIDDHVLILQLERAQESLSDRVEKIEEHGEQCDCDCADTALSRLDDNFDDLRGSLAAAVNIITELTERVASLEEKNAKLIDMHDDLLKMIERTLLQ